jgi:hypothetical protein
MTRRVPDEKCKDFWWVFSVYILLDGTGVEHGRLDASDNPRRWFGWHRCVMLVTTLQDLWLNNLSRSVYAPIILLLSFLILLPLRLAPSVRPQSSPLAHRRRLFRFHRVYHLRLARTSLHPQRAYHLC